MALRHICQERRFGFADSLTHFSPDSSTSHNNNNNISSTPPSTHHPLDPSAPIPLMTDYTIDGTIYRSPDTLNTLITIGPTPTKGLAVFALRDLPPHTLLLSERPLIALNDNGARTDPLDGLVNALSPPLKRAYRSLHGFSSSSSTSNGTTTTTTTKAKCAPPRESLNRRVLYSNGFAIERTTTAVFEVASRINHSCVPNARFRWDDEARRMDYYTVTKVLEGEEVCIDYGHTKGRLLKYYGFECACGGCTEWGSVTSSGGGGDDGGAGVNSASSEGGAGAGGGEVRLVQVDGLWRPVEVPEIAAAVAAVAVDGDGDEEKARVVMGCSAGADELEKENVRPESSEV